MSQKNTVKTENNFSLEKSRNIHCYLQMPASFLAYQSYETKVMSFYTFTVTIYDYWKTNVLTQSLLFTCYSA